MTPRDVPDWGLGSDPVQIPFVETAAAVLARFLWTLCWSVVLGVAIVAVGILWLLVVLWELPGTVWRWCAQARRNVR